MEYLSNRFVFISVYFSFRFEYVMHLNFASRKFYDQVHPELTYSKCMQTNTKTQATN